MECLTPRTVCLLLQHPAAVHYLVTAAWLAQLDKRRSA